MTLRYFQNGNLNHFLNDKEGRDLADFHPQAPFLQQPALI